MAIVSVLDKYFDQVEPICKAICPNGYEDLAQEVYIKMIENPPRDENVNAWIYTIAKNQMLDDMKCNKLVIVDDLSYIEALDNENFKKKVDDIIRESNLTHTEILWIKAYLQHDLNYVWIESDTKISRQHASKRIKGIIKKIQCNLK